MIEEKLSRELPEEHLEIISGLIGSKEFMEDLNFIVRAELPNKKRKSFLHISDIQTKYIRCGTVINYLHN